ncbi:Kringle domain containing protein [Novymonas esmeraldas]|uniref:Kringle domain containing protein n=1 Tax=Novymonas esmeraldas TaxID=1808958 RepID=A0AAW0F2R3_9TRYP
MHAFARAASAALVSVAVVLLLLLVSDAATPAVAARPSAACGRGEEVYYLADGQDYRGRVNVTVGGIPCQWWSAQTPHTHEIPLDPATGVGNHNYCRNANGLERPGCFTATPGGGYQFCDVGAVCTQSPVASATVLFAPVTGSKMVADGSHNYVTLSCYPRPCKIYYALGAEALASATSPAYTQPLLLTESTTVKTYVVYETAPPMRAQARYTVTQTTTPAPTHALRFAPSDAVVYHQPIMVELEGTTAFDRVLLYWNDDLAHPTTYTGGAFRLAESTSLVAVVNGTYVISAAYTVKITAPPLNVYPPSGTFVGGVAILVNDPQPPSTYYMYVNKSTELVPVDSLLLRWTVAGASELDFRALHVGGIESATTVLYNVVPALPPTISPDPASVYHRPVTVTCTAPLGTPVPLSVYRDPAMQDAVAERAFSVLLGTPGEFTVTCSYTDDVQVVHTTTAVLRLVAAPLSPPTFTPACGSNFPAIALLLRTTLNASLLLPGALPTSWSVSVAATGGARVPVIARVPDNSTDFLYSVFQSRPIAVPTTMVVSATAHSLDPLEADSPRATCAYSLYPLAAAATPFFSAIPSCAMTSAPASPACVVALKLELASCLHFYSTELLAMDVLGPIVAMRMTGLAEAIRTDMYARMGACLANLQRRGVIAELHNETSGEIVLATSWHVATPQRMAPQVYTGLPVTVHVTGFHADAGAYRLVRSGYSCEDVGVLPEAVLAASPYATAGGAPPATSDGSTYLTFRVPTAGAYKLCTYISGALYAVPFSSAAPGASTPSIDQYLEVVVQPWPAVDATPAEECGGLVAPNMEDVVLSLPMAATPAGAYAALDYSYNSAGWASAAFPVDPATQLGGAVTLPIGPLNHRTRPLQVFDASLGPTTGAARSCVFFVSATNPPVQLESIQYLFYKVNATGLPASEVGLILMLQGVFHPGELIVIDVYEQRTSTSASAGGASLQLLRRVTARPSTASAYAVALPDSVLSLPTGGQRTPFVVHATLDGVHVTATPSAVALSPLTLAMTPCTTCPSGLCYAEQCLCKNKRTKIVSICGTDSDEDSSSGGHGSHHSSSAASSSSSSSSSPPEEDLKPASLWKRLGFLFAYLGLLAAISAYILISIKRGGSRREHASHADEVTVEPA